jgi:hypothetical protein
MKLMCNKIVYLILLFALTMQMFNCTTSSPTSNNTNSRANQKPKSELSFINKVWRVSKSSSVATGQLYVFLSDGTLVITSPQSKPMLGTWAYEDGAFTITEQSLTYKVEIVKVNESEFNIRIINPGQPTEVEFVAATESGETK